MFNFFEPDYQLPGAIANAGLYSPEFQTLNESTLTSASNSYYTYSWNSYVGMSSPPSNRPLLNLAPLVALASDPTAMVAEVNKRMMYGSMSSNMQSVLRNMLIFMDGASATDKARTLVYVTALSPEYAVQR